MNRERAAQLAEKDLLRKKDEVSLYYAFLISIIVSSRYGIPYCYKALRERYVCTCMPSPCGTYM